MSYTHPDSMHGQLRGASVLLVDVHDEKLASIAEELRASGRVGQLIADLRDPDCAQRIVAVAVDAFGTVHGLVNHAIASNEPKAFLDITAEDFALGHDVGSQATFLRMQTGGGSIVHLGSGTGTGGEPKWGARVSAIEPSVGWRKSLHWNGAATTSGSTWSACSSSPAASSSCRTTTPKRCGEFR
jgi:NAD(P)-dependent dehydrogenase (short-subunit alcohol dehydrogenase family)